MMLSVNEISYYKNYIQQNGNVSLEEKKWTIVVISTRFLHCTQYVTWENVDHMHRIHSGTCELHEG